MIENDTFDCGKNAYYQLSFHYIYFYDTVEGFIVMTDYHCGGESIRLWGDNTDANFGGPSSIISCKQTCAIHEECAAFNVFDNICTFWAQGPLKPYKANKLDCYIKSKGGK